MDITVLGKGCSRCTNTIQMIEAEAGKKGVPVNITKVTDEIEIVRNGVMATPAVIIDGKIVHSGGVPSADTVRSWLK